MTAHRVYRAIMGYYAEAATAAWNEVQQFLKVSK